MQVGYAGYPPRPKGRLPLVRDVFDPARMMPAHRRFFEDVHENAQRPFTGITTDGRLRSGLFGIADEGLATAAAVTAAAGLLSLLGPEERRALSHPLDAAEWRLWTNAYPVWQPHGLLLQDTAAGIRQAVMAVVSSCLSTRGAREVSDCMRLNAVLGEVVGDYRASLTEWMYRFSLFGTPSPDQPWGWQLTGHHLDLHCLILGRQLVLTPAFLGAEPRISDRAPYPGVRLFDAAMERGLALVRSLAGPLRRRAVLAGSMRPGDLPPELNHPIEGRMRAVRGGDNLVLAYEGACAADMSDSQRTLLSAVVEAYTGRLPGAPAAARLARIERHYQETYFAWVGTAEDGDPLYYKIHSPVVLIELDCHPGVFLANDEPEQFHVHTVTRTPNGNDYGRDLLRQHYRREHHRRGHPPAPDGPGESRP